MSTESASHPTEAAIAGTTGSSTQPASPSPLDTSPFAASLAPKERIAPLEAATRHIARFVQTLQFADQRSVFNECALAFIKTFATYFCELKNIVKAKGDIEYCPSCCTVNVPFQPLDRVKESPAYHAFATEVADITKKMKLQAGALHLKGRFLNNTARKEELFEILAKALPRFADFVLIEDDAESYGKHDLVADLLLLHHKTIF